MDPAPDPTPDPTPFLIDFKMQKINYFFTFFSHNLPIGTGYIIISLKFCVKMLFHSAQHIYEKTEGSGAGADPGGPKTCGSGSGSRSPTLPIIYG
jgi:hypothetical protein